MILLKLEGYVVLNKGRTDRTGLPYSGSSTSTVFLLIGTGIYGMHLCGICRPCRVQGRYYC